MSPLSDRPEARRRQIDNLRRGQNPAPSGNQRALKHGGFAAVARERLEEREREVYEALSEDLPLREADGSAPRADSVVVSLFATVLCRLEDVAEYHRRRGIETAKGHLRNSVEVEGRLRREALDFAESLGLTPRSRARLGLDLARGVDLAAQWAAEGDDDTIDAEATEATEDADDA